MSNIRATLAIVSVAGALIAVPAALHAEEPPGPSGSMMRGGMMGGGQMMERMSRMMEQCSAMMQGGPRGDRPDDRQRRDTPTVPDQRDR